MHAYLDFKGYNSVRINTDANVDRLLHMLTAIGAIELDEKTENYTTQEKAVFEYFTWIRLQNTGE